MRALLTILATAALILGLAGPSQANTWHGVGTGGFIFNYDPGHKGSGRAIRVQCHDGKQHDVKLNHTSSPPCADVEGMYAYYAFPIICGVTKAKPYGTTWYRHGWVPTGNSFARACYVL